MLASHNVMPRERSFGSKVSYLSEEACGDMKEAIPPNAPEPRGNYVHISAFVDAAHAGNLVTRHVIQVF